LIINFCFFCNWDYGHSMKSLQRSLGCLELKTFLNCY
jgi:hypothetical protein